MNSRQLATEIPVMKCYTTFCSVVNVSHATVHSFRKLIAALWFCSLRKDAENEITKPAWTQVPFTRYLAVCKKIPQTFGNDSYGEQAYQFISQRDRI